MNQLKPMGETRQHLMLLRTMAAQTGADTVLAFEEGSLSADAWASAVTRCRGCEWAEGCKTWLAQDVARPRPVPSACANAELLRGLKLPS